MLVLASLKVVSAATTNTEQVFIHISAINTEKLQVRYTLNRAVESIHFLVTPDQSRATFWKANSDDFELTHIDGRDFIKRSDGKPFKTAVFVVKIVDISLPNYYRPFSPMFDRNNGLVMHTGQYFVCTNTCGERTTWQFKVSAPNKNIIHHEGASVSVASWQDTDDGRSFYLGSRTPIESENLIAIVDPGLPNNLTKILSGQLPTLTDLMGEKLETLQSKPLVFATYDSDTPERRGFQGGVLNKTVFMHWWGPDLDQRINENDELWFIAHEIAHFYQSQKSAVDVDDDAWIHEGFAELMAGELLAQTNVALKNYVENRYLSASADCLKGLKATPLAKATQLKQFDLHYQCGLLLHRFIGQKAIIRLDVFQLWNLYRTAINQGLKPSRETYLSVVKQLLSTKDFVILKTIIGHKIVTNKTTDYFIENLALTGQSN